MTRISARDHWNARYRERGWPEEPSSWLVEHIERIPHGRILDVAGGTGRNALWLASHGRDVTIVDASDVALDIARARADDLGTTVRTIEADLTAEALPAGPWDAILLFHYLDRNLFPALHDARRPGGILIGAIATVRNLERHDRPPRPFVLDEGELPGLLDRDELLEYEEGWREDRHDARFVARRP